VMAAAGSTPTYVREEKRGMAGVQQNITYKRELFAGAIVEIWSHFVSVGERKMVWIHEMRDAENGEVCAICELTGVHIDREKRRAAPFPPDIRARTEALIAGNAAPS